MLDIKRGTTSWLQEHLESFVKPRLGFIPSASDFPLLFLPNEMSVIKNIWRSVKKASEGKTLVLPGRDVFMFEILARRENFPTVFLPGCSRMSVEYFKDKLPANAFIFDTGFAGSIPRNLSTQDFKMISYCMKGSEKQTFPRLTMSRHLALKIEKTPKYWKTGQYVTDVRNSKWEILEPKKFYQDFADENEFFRAAVLTIQVYKDSSPAFVNKRRPLGGNVMEGIWPLWLK